MDYSIAAIILSSEPSGENDEIFTVFSPELGIFEAKAKSSKKITSKLKMSLQEFSFVNMTLAPRWKTLIPTIIGCEILENFTKIKKNCWKMFLAITIGEIILKSSAKYYENNFLFNLFLKALKKINQLPEKKLNIYYNNFIYFFLMKIFINAGLSPQTKECLSCGKKEQLHYFSPLRGGVLCVNCYKPENQTILVRQDVLKILNELKKEEWAFVSKLRLTKFQNFILRKILLDFYQIHFHQRLLSLCLIPC